MHFEEEQYKTEDKEWNQYEIDDLYQEMKSNAKDRLSQYPGTQ